MTCARDAPRGLAGILGLFEAGLARGLSPARILVGSGLTAAALRDVHRTVAASAELTVARNLIEALGDRPGLGVEAGLRMTVGTLGVYGYAIASAPTLREALATAGRFRGLSPGLVRCDCQQRPDATTLLFDDRAIPVDVRDLLLERDLAALLPLFRIITGGPLPGPLETRLTGARLRALSDAAGPATVLGGQRANRVVIAAARLARPSPMADPVAHAVCRLESERLVGARARGTTTTERVRLRLLAEPDQRITVEQVAGDLFLSPRALRRRLAEEGSSFRRVRRLVLVGVAAELLQGGSQPVAEVGRRLGFADATSFSRAFARWTGRSPRQYVLAGVREGDPETAAGGTERSPSTPSPRERHRVDAFARPGQTSKPSDS
ncbi:AraC family transcriptional regulator [Patulibacter defluvii]|uniref:AraC family transcriptional regulator n=1 Tax=Patulibacter defluvii TaxID=3095358 RepID=UPI002A74A1CC|nr:AraC family transcriptional regulator ligand-binding domain-containing protein [Patulibacter sp. DM4]